MSGRNCVVTVLVPDLLEDLFDDPAPQEHNLEHVVLQSAV